MCTRANLARAMARSSAPRQVCLPPHALAQLSVLLRQAHGLAAGATAPAVIRMETHA